ncbi:MAG TPA: FAD-dependent oxidoreductase [Pseudonocardiaceae bacterium]|nr:FAD-dependent oxidoreductase [Pseudonocardiaceae bacterium]
MNTTCVVAGGGPAGMMLGLLLARAGVDVTVLEKHGDFLRDFRGDTVHPATLRLLDELGLGDRFRALPQSRVDRVEFPDADGELVTIGDFTKLPGRYRHVAMVPQWDLLDMLADAAAAEPTFHLRMNTEAVDVLRDHGRIAGVRCRTEDGTEEEIRADLTVAADGRWSAVRTAAGLRPHEFPVPIDAWWFRVPRYPTDPDTGLTGRAHERMFALAINRGDYYQIAYLGGKGTDEALRAEGVEAFRKRMSAVLPDLAGRMDGIASMDDVKHLDVRLNRLRRWAVPGLLCIGDAAHAMSPAGGVGINLAIQDAVATARLLAKPLREHRLRAADVARVQRRRTLPTVGTQQLQRLLHKVGFEPVVRGTRQGLPASLARTMGRWPGLRVLPAFVVGIGILPEHAPAFARR